MLNKYYSGMLQDSQFGRDLIIDNICDMVEARSAVSLEVVHIWCIRCFLYSE